MFEIYEPKRFFAEFVDRAFAEYRANQLDALRVKTAVHQFNVMAERVWHSCKEKEAAKIAHAQTAGVSKAFGRP